MVKQQHENKVRPRELDPHDGSFEKPPAIKDGGPDKVVVYLAIEMCREDLKEAWEDILDGLTGYGAIIGAEVWLGRGD